MDVSGDLLDRPPCRPDVEVSGAEATPAEREASVETLRYAINGFLAAVRADRAARTAGADSPQVQRHRVLMTLADELDLDAATLATVVGMPLSQVSGLLTVMGREGLVEGVRPGRGRGATVTRLTPAGLRALDELDTGFRRHWEAVVEDLPAEDLRTAARVISRLTGVIVPSR
ncbi:MarR family winged helix-turn-helix transcriptional regulator [Yinghuangia seranimata]|uniref:MarR family winged helix-turn-helix transcriptional regulator n=1 Tax=Yinghuangia seranimata TaxID=408067 RepID=UPI00248AF8DA|nr:MarR family winged helix-turn-helix transcriptional regulator [Yinghuangia seranimata]MDI2125150.1 MarR family winged helix-turn-helix transcriptional regulator [Yinghuangia seranimata]